MAERFSSLALALALSLVPRTAPAADTQPPRPDQPAVVIVTSSTVDAFQEAIGGIRRALPAAAKVVVFDLADKPEGLASQLRSKDVRLVITVGTNALDAASKYASAPIVATMILWSDLSSSRPGTPAGAVVLDLPLTDVLARLADVFPGKARAGMIRNPDTLNTPAGTLASQARSVGMTLTVADCSRPEDLLRSFLSMRDRVDFVWAPPDGTLYTSATVRPLIMASLENRLPAVGFSASFVRTGAVAGVYPDYVEVGLQAGEMARKYISGVTVAGSESPRKIHVAVNPRVGRLLGLRPFQKGETVDGITVIQ
jgi:ABC-type uncharacterized transport system substrate-binding protein